MFTRFRFTDGARKVVVLAQDEARELGHGFVGPGHLLLGLLAEGDDITAQVLVGRGAGYDLVREWVVALLAGWHGVNGLWEIRLGGLGSSGPAAISFPC